MTKHKHYTVVGQSITRLDSPDAVTGKTRFADDFTFPGMLHAKLVRSPHAHARILSINTEKAMALEGVHAVITGQDMPVEYGILPWTRDEYPLALEKALFVQARPVRCSAGPLRAYDSRECTAPTASAGCLAPPDQGLLRRHHAAQ